MIKMPELKCNVCGKKLVSKVRDPDKECLLVVGNISKCNDNDQYRCKQCGKIVSQKNMGYNGICEYCPPQGLTVEQTILIFSQMATHRMRLFISKLELPPGQKTLIGMGIYGVAAANDQWKVDKLLPKLKSIKKEFEEIEKLISER
jgi:DNA-directed RNA polymerase subunit RPC12/RpoP